MSSKLEYDIKEKYGYENGGSKMDGSLATNIKQLRKMIGELLLKIQNGRMEQMMK